MRRAGVASLLALLLVGGYRWEWLPFLAYAAHPPRREGDLGGIDRKPLRLRRDPLPDDFRAILDETLRRMQRGDSVGFVFGPPGSGYSYAYYRAVQSVAPRRALLPLPLDDPNLPAHVGKATFITTWDHDLTLPEFEEVARIGRGRLLRKR